MFFFFIIYILFFLPLFDFQRGYGTTERSEFILTEVIIYTDLSEKFGIAYNILIVSESDA